MIKTYITFGQTHHHFIDGTVFDKDCVAEVIAPSEKAARAVFHPLFCFSYTEEQFKERCSAHNMMSYFPRGVLSIQASAHEG